MQPTLEKGRLLVAMPTLHDPNFRHSVVLLCEHGPDGSLGLVINRPTAVEVATLINDLPDLPARGRVFAGGPVAKDGLLILCLGAAAEPDGGHRILPDVYLAKDVSVMRAPERLGPGGELRCYVGYAGWAAGQLEAELATGAWSVRPAESRLVFAPDVETVWPEMMRRLGGRWALFAGMPPDPSLN